MSDTVLLDVSSFIHRAYHVSKERPTYTKDRVPNAAVNVFRTMIQKLKKDNPCSYLVGACDIHQPTFRTKLYPEYKAQRATPDQDLVLQIPGCRAVLEQEHVTVFELAGYEADDVIGTLAKHYQQFSNVIIVSGDKDMAQLVDDGNEFNNIPHCYNIVLFNTNKNKLLGGAGVLEEYGVLPHQVVDYLSLVGDTSDNVPGCKGIGEKGALDLIRTFGTVEAIIARAGEIEDARYRRAVRANTETILLSKKLVTIDCDVPIPTNELWGSHD